MSTELSIVRHESIDVDGMRARSLAKLTERLGRAPTRWDIGDEMAHEEAENPMLGVTFHCGVTERTINDVVYRREFGARGTGYR